jgi:replication factor A1
LGRSQASNMMAKDLKDRSKVEEIVLTIVEKSEPREFQSKWSGASGRVCDAVGKDEEGENVKLTLWNDDIDRVQVDARIKITNGWVSSYKNELQVSTGKFGKLDIIEE